MNHVGSRWRALAASGRKVPGQGSTASEGLSDGQVAA